MTTIACDGHWMAADGLVTTNAEIIAEFDVAKVMRLKDGSILGVAGAYHAIDPLRQFLNGDAKDLDIDGAWDAIRLMPDGSGQYYCDKHPRRGAPCSWPSTLGSGGQLALGALLAGKTPKQAVEIAAQRDTGTGGQIICLAVDSD